MTTETSINLFELNGLSMRTLNVLNRYGYKTVADLEGVKPDTLLGLPGIGKRGMAELERELEPYGISFPEPILTVKALIDALRYGQRSAISIAHLVGYPVSKVTDALAILEEFGVVSHTFDGAAVFRLNPWFLRACDGRAA